MFHRIASACRKFQIRERKITCWGTYLILINLLPSQEMVDFVEFICALAYLIYVSSLLYFMGLFTEVCVPGLMEFVIWHDELITIKISRMPTFSSSSLCTSIRSSTVSCIKMRCCKNPFWGSPTFSKIAKEKEINLNQLWSTSYR